MQHWQANIELKILFLTGEFILSNTLLFPEEGI